MKKEKEFKIDELSIGDLIYYLCPLLKCGGFNQYGIVLNKRKKEIYIHWLVSTSKDVIYNNKDDWYVLSNLKRLS